MIVSSTFYHLLVSSKQPTCFRTRDWPVRSKISFG